MRYLLDVLTAQWREIEIVAVCGQTTRTADAEGPGEYVTTPTLVTCRDCIDALARRRAEAAP